MSHVVSAPSITRVAAVRLASQESRMRWLGTPNAWTVELRVSPRLGWRSPLEQPQCLTFLAATRWLETWRADYVSSLMIGDGSWPLT